VHLRPSPAGPETTARVHATRIVPPSGPTDRRRLAAAALSAVVPGLGQVANRRRTLALTFLVPTLILVALVWLAFQLSTPIRLAAAAIAPTALSALLIANLVVLAWRLASVGHAFFDRRYPATPGRLGFIGLVVVLVFVALPHVLAWQVGSAAGQAFQQIFSSATTAGHAATAIVPADGKRINVLLIGVDKTNQRSATLTDTMIVVSIDPVDKDVAMVSIPRDTVGVPLGNGDTFGPKLNSLLGFAERNPKAFPKGPVRALEDAVGALLGIEINYYARIDFRGFIRLVDAVGGVDINVQKGFDAPEYEGFGLGTRGWSITAGRHHLDGPNALAYARARKAAGESDFTRQARQQQILVGLRQKVASSGSLLFDLPALFDAVGQTVSTDMPVDRLPQLAAISDEMGKDAITQVVIKAPLVHPKRTQFGDSQVPDLAAIRALAAELFSAPGTPSARPSPSASTR
jgi:LCP family protein required for cell wall assembly